MIRAVRPPHENPASKGQAPGVIELVRHSEPAGTVFAPAASTHDAVWSAARPGWIILVVFFGILLGWTLFAPLNGAVVAEGHFRTDGNRKSIQHLDGGIVSELKVREGSRVQAGETLLVLDPTHIRAEVDVLSQQYVVLRMTQERLKAELADAISMEYPAEFAANKTDPDYRKLWQIQVQQFDARRKSLDGQRRVVDERIAQLKERDKGSEEQLKSQRSQLASIQAERASLLPLLERGLVTRPRISQLERNAAAIEGQIGDLTSKVGQSAQAISEQLQLAIQLGNDRMAEITRELRDTQSGLVEVVPKLASAKASLERTIVRSPYEGRVVDLAVFSIGGVVGRGEKMMDVVPDKGALVIEARIPPEEIAEVRPNMPADIHLIAYKERATPVVRGEIANISADRLTDTRNGRPYFMAEIRVSAEELAKLPGVKPYPGMPATVMMTTVERTAFRYLVDPLMMSFRSAFRQK